MIEFLSGGGSGADTVINIATVEVRFGAVVLINSNPFDLQPDELLEIIIAQSLSGLNRGSSVRKFTRLQNVCSRFRRIVMPHQRGSLPRFYLDGNICPGYNSVMRLIRKYGKGSDVVIELKDIICSKKWSQAWVELVLTGLRWWFYIRRI